MIIEIGEGLMTILVLAFIFTLLIAPEMIIVIVVVGVLILFNSSLTGNPITVKGPDGIIFQTTVNDVNSTGVAPNSEVVELK